MTIEEGMTVALKNITLTGGDATTLETVRLGGAILNYGALTLEGCTITGNTAEYGGGIYSATALGINSLTIKDSTISGNSSNLDGGGIYARGTHVQIDQSVFTSNSATRNGGGYFKASYSGSSSTMTNCTLVANSASVSGGGVVGSTLSNSYVGTIPTDLAGNPRIADGPVDMGVFEEQGPAIYYVSLSGDDDADGFSWETAKQTIQAAVDTVAVGSTIMVDDGVYETGSRVVHGSLPNRVVVDKAIVLRSQYHPDLATAAARGVESCTIVSCRATTPTREAVPTTAP